MYVACDNYINAIESGEKQDAFGKVKRFVDNGGEEDEELEKAKDAIEYHADQITIPIGNVFGSISSDVEVTNTNESRDMALNRLLYEYALVDESQEPERAAKLESDILGLGWIPGIPYDLQSKKRAGLLEAANKSKYDIVDKTDTPDNDVEEEEGHTLLYPIYIVLVEGVTIFSKAVKAYTHGPFSHAAICIDNTFKKMYSFNISGSEGKLGGLSIEDAKKYPQDSKLGVFAIFVKEKDYYTIQNLLERYEKNKKNTTYSFLNILTLLSNKSFKMDFSMICSEFVDNILKYTNIDIVDKESPLVTPNDFYSASKSNKKIYKMYEGKVKNFSPKSIANKVGRIKKEYIKEFAVMESEFPVQFSADGDLIIKNMKKLNYDAEIARSNKLLKIY
jgi:hypothetical protein